MANPQPDGFTRISNELLAAILMYDFTKRQLNVILLVIRLSYGCGKKYALLQKSDFEIAGIDKSDIKKELDLLRRSGVLIINNNRIRLQEDYDHWQISLVRVGSIEKFKKILQCNLQEKTDQNTQPNGPEGAERNVEKEITLFAIPAERQGNGAQHNAGKGEAQELESGNDSEYDQDFLMFWTEYPRKIEKKHAYRCWRTRTKKGVPADDLIIAAKNYAADCQKMQTKKQYIKHASTFLGPDLPYLDWIDRLEDEKDVKKKLIKSLYLN